MLAARLADSEEASTRRSPRSVWVPYRPAVYGGCGAARSARATGSPRAWRCAIRSARSWCAPRSPSTAGCGCAASAAAVRWLSCRPGSRRCVRSGGRRRRSNADRGASHRAGRPRGCWAIYAGVQISPASVRAWSSRQPVRWRSLIRRCSPPWMTARSAARTRRAGRAPDGPAGRSRLPSRPRCFRSPSTATATPPAGCWARPIGTIVSDRYAVYLFIDDSQRQLFLAHLLREFNPPPPEHLPRWRPCFRPAAPGRFWSDSWASEKRRAERKPPAVG